METLMIGPVYLQIHIMLFVALLLLQVWLCSKCHQENNNNLLSRQSLASHYAEFTVILVVWTFLWSKRGWVFSIGKPLTLLCMLSCLKHMLMSANVSSQHSTHTYCITAQQSVPSLISHYSVSRSVMYYRWCFHDGLCATDSLSVGEHTHTPTNSLCCGSHFLLVLTAAFIPSV